MSVQKLRIYAMVMRLQELEKDRLEEIRQRRIRLFLPEPIIITMPTRHENFSHLYGRNGKLFELPKSKYHK